MKMHTPILTAVEQAAREGLREVGREVLKRARELSPTDTGESDKSGFVAMDDLTLQVGFKSPVSKWNHENLDWQHLDGGEPKFLEKAVEEVDIEARMAAKVREHLG
ncbi:hypothetical protein [Agromyces sp. NPDC058064]|uniref:hypothetical protein n=1 Tax=Agromyces sp. NPDC058064 TaxID=3346322 RepID=UPI0036D8BF8A